MTRARDLADGADKDITGTLTLDDIVLSNDMSVADNGKVQFGAGNDLQIFHNASASYITDQGTGNLVLGGDAAILLQNSAHSANMLDAYDGGRVGLYHNGTLKAATTSTGIDVTGNATFGDNGKAIFGAGSDLQIYHDGLNSYISEGGTGNLFLGGTNMFMRSSTGETYIGAIQDGAVTLYHNNAAKLATTSTGVDVTGTVTADGLDVQGDGTISGGSRLTISDIADVNNDGIRLDDNTTGRFNNLTQDTSGNFKIQHWTGSAWQNNFTLSTAGKLGLGTTSPSTTLDVAGNVSLGTNSSNTITLTGSIDLGTL